MKHLPINTLVTRARRKLDVGGIGQALLHIDRAWPSKLRMKLACRFAREVTHLMPQASRDALEVIERYAEGAASKSVFKEAAATAAADAKAAYVSAATTADAAAHAAAADAYAAAYAATAAAAYAATAAAARAKQAEILREFLAELEGASQ